MERYYFLPEDFASLEELVQNTADKMRNVQKEMAQSVKESSETWHDNFGYEDGRRRLTMWSKRLGELRDIRSNAVLVKPKDQYDSVAIGCRVTVEDIDSRERKTYRIGSYMNLSEAPDTLSYNSPLARILMRAKEDEEIRDLVNGQKHQYLVISIDP